MAMENPPKMDFMEMFVYQSVCHYVLFLPYWLYTLTTLPETNSSNLKMDGWEYDGFVHG